MQGAGRGDLRAQNIENLPTFIFLYIELFIRKEIDQKTTILHFSSTCSVQRQ